MAWGKHFSSMYEGSMRGAGSAFFAVWGYVLSHMTPHRKLGTTVEINCGIVAFLLGEEEAIVAAQIAKMCEPDPHSRTKDKGGRKLVKLSDYTYEVVNGAYYRNIRNEDERREYQRVKQAEYRWKAKKGKGNGKVRFDPNGAAIPDRKEKIDAYFRQNPDPTLDRKRPHALECRCADCVPSDEQAEPL